MVRFAVIGVNHSHIYAQTDLLLRAGAELTAFFAEEADLAATYGRHACPHAACATGSGRSLDATQDGDAPALRLRSPREGHR